MSSLSVYLEEWKLLTDEEKDHVVNGCGPKFGFLGRIVPDFGGIYTPPCNLHDWLYWSGGPIEIKDLADLKFKDDLRKVNRTLSWWKRWSLVFIPDLYYSMVRWLGKPAYHEAPKRRTREDIHKSL